MPTATTIVTAAVAVQDGILFLAICAAIILLLVYAESESQLTHENEKLKATVATLALLLASAKELSVELRKWQRTAEESRKEGDESTVLYAEKRIAEIEA